MLEPETSTPQEPEPQSDREPTPAQWSVVLLVFAFSTGSILYKVLRHIELGQSAAMFIGIPAILAICLALAPRARTVTGGILKGITLALLIIAPLLGEGYLCILVASPLFYIVGIVVGLIVDWNRRRTGQTLSCIAIVLLPMCLEGVVPQLTFNRTQTVKVTKVVAISTTAVEHNLTQSPNITLRLPAFLRTGFPVPLTATGSGLNPGDLRTIHFTGAEGDPPGDLTLRVAERSTSANGENYVRFEAIADSTKLTQWLQWQSSEVSWHPIDSAHTQVTWTVRFNRQLDPAWYFTPWEKYAVRQAADYLITANAASSTPEEPR